VEDTGGVVFVPAFSGLLAPYWRDDARGVIVGLTQFSTKAHICRAMLEAICFQTKEVLIAMEQDAVRGTTAGWVRVPHFITLISLTPLSTSTFTFDLRVYWYIPRFTTVCVWRGGEGVMPFSVYRRIYLSISYRARTSSI
jgi:hypothetical protein